MSQKKDKSLESLVGQYPRPHGKANLLRMVFLLGTASAHVDFPQQHSKP
jgi:hypothetical protein